MENPRSEWVSRQALAREMVSAISSAEMSRCRRMRTVRPARRARVTAWRTPRMSEPDSLKSEVRKIASSPSSRALRPRSRKAWAPCELAPITPGAQPYVLHNANHSSMACGHALGSPTGSPLARQTPTSTRKVMAARPLWANTTDLSRRVAK